MQEFHQESVLNAHCLKSGHFLGDADTDHSHFGAEIWEFKKIVSFNEIGMWEIQWVFI